MLQRFNSFDDGARVNFLVFVPCVELMPRGVCGAADAHACLFAGLSPAWSAGDSVTSTAANPIAAFNLMPRVLPHLVFEIMSNNLIVS